MLEAERLGPEGAALGSVLEWLQRFSRNITQDCEGLTKSLLQLIAEIQSAVFQLNAAKLQIEMTTEFAREVLRTTTGVRGAAPCAPGAMQQLYVSSRGTVEQALSELAGVEENLPAVESSQQNLGSRSVRYA
jgi:hypothetical protein